jgi:uncharacterized protein with HEPN domain
MYLDDILESMNKIENYTRGLDYEKFVQRDMVIDAVIRNFEIIGEASKNIPEDVRNCYPDIPWGKMVGLRNIVVHAYFGVDLSIIWEIITKNLPEVKLLIEKSLKKEKNKINDTKK